MIGALPAPPPGGTGVTTVLSEGALQGSSALGGGAGWVAPSSSGSMDDEDGASPLRSSPHPAADAAMAAPNPIDAIEAARESAASPRGLANGLMNDDMHDSDAPERLRCAPDGRHAQGSAQLAV
ncbi:MAG TPA: hypothetical protein VFT22_22380 [Kofleriaceae bacterium]|nr:hypothetical protein [Kofleriaceae bacterium]